MNVRYMYNVLMCFGVYSFNVIPVSYITPSFLKSPAFSDIIEEMGSVSGLGVANSAHSVDHKSEWPFVTLSNFRQRAGNARHLSGALLVTISPLVTQENLAKWEEFVQDPLNNFWVDAGHDHQQQLGNDNFEYPPNIERSILHQNRTIDPVHHFDSSGLPHVESTNFEEYLPVWQSSPVLKTRYINENLKTKTIHENQLRGNDDDSRNTTSFSRSFLAGMLDKVIFQEESAFVGGFDMAPPGTVRHENPTTAQFATLMSIAAGKEGALTVPSPFHSFIHLLLQVYAEKMFVSSLNFFSLFLLQLSTSETLWQISVSNLCLGLLNF